MLISTENTYTGPSIVEGLADLPDMITKSRYNDLFRSKDNPNLKKHVDVLTTDSETLNNFYEGLQVKEDKVEDDEDDDDDLLSDLSSNVFDKHRDDLFIPFKLDEKNLQKMEQMFDGSKTEHDLSR